MGFLTIIPLLSIPVLVYNVMAVSGQTFATTEWVRERLEQDWLAVNLPSGAVWQITPGAVLLIVALLMLFFELIKSTRSDKAAVMNHAFSMVIFIICLVEFLLFDAFATSVFFIIMIMTLLDTMAGFIVTINSARRDFGVGEGFGE